MDYIVIYNLLWMWFFIFLLLLLCIWLIWLLLVYGDYVVVCLLLVEIENDDRSVEFCEFINECKSNCKDCEGWKD